MNVRALARNGVGQERKYLKCDDNKWISTAIRHKVTVIVKQRKESHPNERKSIWHSSSSLISWKRRHFSRNSHAQLIWYRMTRFGFRRRAMSISHFHCIAATVRKYGIGSGLFGLLICGTSNVMAIICLITSTSVKGLQRILWIAFLGRSPRNPSAPNACRCWFQFRFST